MHKGPIHLRRLSTDPVLYSATFQTTDGLLGGQWDRTFTDLGDLDKFLQQVAVPSPQIRAALRETRRGKTANIANVILCDHELKDFVNLVKSAPRKQTG